MPEDVDAVVRGDDQRLVIQGFDHRHRGRTGQSSRPSPRRAWVVAGLHAPGDGGDRGQVGLRFPQRGLRRLPAGDVLGDAQGPICRPDPGSG